MRPRPLISGVLLTAIVLIAADPAWKTKPVAQWTKDDAREVTLNSPWVKHSGKSIVPERGEAQLREGGKMGGGGERAGLGKVDASARGSLAVRWESAAPLRAAEILAGETSPPDWDGDFYAIAVYDVPGIGSSTPKSLRVDIRLNTLLKREGKKDVKPARVEIIMLPGNMADILYLFPRSAEIGADDHRIEFTSLIGRTFVAVAFDATEMTHLGKLEL